jgi:tetratricopeptide (TPR) repeat protein
VFQRTARLEPTNAVVAAGWLLQGQSKLVQGDFAAAADVLNRINPAGLTPQQDWQRANRLCRANLGRNDLGAALAAATNLLQIAIAGQGRGGGWTTNLAESIALHADLLERAGRPDEAAAEWGRNLTNSAPVEIQRQAILKTAELALAQSNLADAEADLENYYRQFPASEPAELALLTLGELHLKDFIAQPAATNHLLLAQARLDQFLAGFTNSPLRAKAYLDRGWCAWVSAERTADAAASKALMAESQADFQAAAQLFAAPGAPASEDLAVARFKLGDAQFALGDFTGAQSNYQAVLTGFGGLTKVAAELGDRALYQMLRARLALTNTAGMDEAMGQLLAKHSAGALADSGLLLAGQGFSNFGLPGKAREVFERFVAERTNSPLLARVAFAAAQTFEQETNWPAAVARYERWLQTYGADEARPAVEYARDWAVAQAGDEARAFGLFTNFFTLYPTNAQYAPLAYWWVGDHYFRSGTNFDKAENDYELVFNNFPANELAYRARLMAGRSALARFNPEQAIRSYLTPLISDTNCPGDLRDQARFAYAEACRAQSVSQTNNESLQYATNMLKQMYGEAATNLAGALAWAETGDCDQLMGAFDAATNAYAQALNAPGLAGANPPPGGQALRFRSQVGIGLMLEKKAEADGLPDEARKALLDQAMANYQAVFYSDAESPDEFWRKEAGLKMLALASRTGRLKGPALDQFISRLEAEFPALKAALELKRVALKN